MTTQAIVSAIQAQRNSALDEVAASAGLIADLKARITELESTITDQAKELEAAKQPPAKKKR